MRFFTFDTEWDFPGTEIGVFFKIVLFNIVFFNVASTKSSNIAGILSLGVIRKRLVGFRLDFLAPTRIDQILTSQAGRSAKFG